MSKLIDSNQMIVHLINGGVCTTTNRSINCEVFQGSNGCFYNRKTDGSETIYTDSFFNLKKKEVEYESLALSKEELDTHINKFNGDKQPSLCIEYAFTADLKVENERQTITQIVFLEELEEDNCLWDTLELKLEEYVQNKYCSCSFNESTSHCDCNLGESNIVDIVSRKIT